MSKKLSNVIQLHHIKLETAVIEDIEGFIKAKRKELGLTESCKFEIKRQIYNNNFVININREMTQAEIDTRDAEIEKEALAKIAAAEIAQKKAEELKLKRSEAAKKAWVTRSVIEAEKKEKDRLAKEARDAKMLAKKAEKEAILAEEKRKKEFLHDLLYGED